MVNGHTCVWKNTCSGNQKYTTECGNSFIFGINFDTQMQSNLKYCYFCGGHLISNELNSDEQRTIKLNKPIKMF